MTDGNEQGKQAGFMHRLCNGDECAFADFVAKYQQQVFLCCRVLGLDVNEAEDIASETFLAAYNGLDRYAGRAKLGTWLWKIAYNKAISYIRRKNRQRKLHNKYANQQKNTHSEPPKNHNNAEIVWNAVKRLPPPQAMAIILYYRQEKSIKEIAHILKKRQNTVKVCLFRGRKRLKEMLAEKIERLY